MLKRQYLSYADFINILQIVLYKNKFKEIEEILALNVKIFRFLRYDLQNKPTAYNYITDAFKIRNI